jgi:hypothetical protein
MSPVVLEIIQDAIGTLHAAADDVACGLKPYESNLRTAHSNLQTALKLIRETEADQ